MTVLVRSISLDQAKALRSTLFVVFSVLPVFPTRDIFILNGGYSFLWLLILYVIGACTGRVVQAKEISCLKCLCGYALCVLLTWGSMLLCTSTPLLARYEQRLISYDSPTILLSALCLLLCFQKLPVRRRPFAAVIRFLAPLSFGVYLIHTHPLIWTYGLGSRFVSYAARPVGQCLGAVFLTALGIYLACTVLELLRRKLFIWTALLGKRLFAAFRKGCR